MRALLIILPVILTSCTSTELTHFSISQREILRRSKAEIALREPWAGSAAIFVQNPGEISRMSWKVRAGAYDFSDHPSYKGIYFVPGTERELRFSSDGCLTSYSNPRRRCEEVVTEGSTGVLMSPGK